MGYMRHHAIVVTSWKGEAIKSAHFCAQMLGCTVTPISDETVNGYVSFLIAPDGSKEGWADSDEGNTRRDQFVEWIGAQAYEDGSSALDWVEVQFGDDNGEAKVTRSGDEYQARAMDERLRAHDA